MRKIISLIIVPVLLWGNCTLAKAMPEFSDDNVATLSARLSVNNDLYYGFEVLLNGLQNLQEQELIENDMKQLKQQIRKINDSDAAVKDYLKMNVLQAQTHITESELEDFWEKGVEIKDIFAMQIVNDFKNDLNAAAKTKWLIDFLGKKGIKIFRDPKVKGEFAYIQDLLSFLFKGSFRRDATLVIAGGMSDLCIQESFEIAVRWAKRKKAFTHIVLPEFAIVGDEIRPEVLKYLKEKKVNYKIFIDGEEKHNFDKFESRSKVWVSFFKTRDSFRNEFMGVKNKVWLEQEAFFNLKENTNLPRANNGALINSIEIDKYNRSNKAIILSVIRDWIKQHPEKLTFDLPVWEQELEFCVKAKLYFAKKDGQIIGLLLINWDAQGNVHIDKLEIATGYKKEGLGAKLLYLASQENFDKQLKLIPWDKDAELYFKNKGFELGQAGLEDYLVQKPLNLITGEKIQGYQAEIIRQLNLQPVHKFPYNEPLQYAENKYQLAAWGNDRGEQFIRLGPLFFMNKNYFDQLDQPLQGQIQPNTIFLLPAAPKLNDAISFGYDAHTLVLIAQMLNCDFSVIDYAQDWGCNDGILSLVALKLGLVKYIDLFDFKELSVTNAQVQLKLNGFKENRNFSVKTISIKDGESVKVLFTQAKKYGNRAAVFANLSQYPHANWATTEDAIKVMGEIKEIELAIISGYTIGRNVNSEFLKRDIKLFKQFGFSVAKTQGACADYRAISAVRLKSKDIDLLDINIKKNANFGKITFIEDSI